MFFHQGELSPIELEVKTRELLQFIDIFLLTDVMWLCDTVTESTMDISRTVIDRFAAHGLTNPRSDGKFRLTRFTDSQIRDCCTICARAVTESLTAIGEGALISTSLGYSLRPAGAQALTFPSIVETPYGTQQSEDFVNNAIGSRGWGPMSAIPFLNPDLYRWMKAFTAAHPNETDAVYTQLNTIFRWKFNETLAEKLSVSEGRKCSVHYAPALGRAMTVKQLATIEWDKNRSFFERQLLHGISNDEKKIADTFLSTIHPSKHIPIPLIGIWILSQLKEDCTIDDLLVEIARLNANNDLIKFKQWLSTASEQDISKTAVDLVRDIARIAANSEATVSKSVQTLQHELILPLPFMVFKIITKRDHKLHLFEIKLIFLMPLYRTGGPKLLSQGWSQTLKRVP